MRRRSRMRRRRTALSWRRTVWCFLRVVSQASEAYLKVAKCEPDEAIAASNYTEAASCMKKVNTSEAVKIMEKAIECYCNTGGIRMVLYLLHQGAKFTRQVAEWYEEDFEYELAIKYYLKASELEDIESSDSFGLQCILKAADLMVLSKEERYVEAIQVIIDLNPRNMKWWPDVI